jgi:hypothetical protein
MAEKPKDRLLRQMAEVTGQLNLVTKESRKLYRKRDALYFKAQEAGASLTEIAKASKVTVAAVKLTMGKRRKELP